MALIVWLTLLLLVWVFIWQGFMIWPLAKHWLNELRMLHKNRGGNGGRQI